MGHNQSTHKACTYAPRGCPHILLLALLRGVLHVEGLGEILTEEVRSAALQCLAILHKGLDGEGVDSTSKALVRRLVTHDDGHAHPLLGEGSVDVNHTLGLLDSLLGGGVCRMSLLPQELGSTQEEACAHLPAHNVGPLVAEDRQVAVRRDPVLVRIPDDGLRRGTHDKLLLEACCRVYDDTLALLVVLEAVVGDHGALLGEALDVAGLAREE